MHLVNPLASGIVGATQGSAKILKRGSLVATTWYEDFEGGSPKTGDVALDANGGAEVYVNELVVVNTYDSNGGFIRGFTAGVDSTNVEVKSLSFTGTGYDPPTVAAGNPTTLQAALDLWKTSSGTTDFNVLVNGAPTSLSTFAASLTDNVFNVTDAAYGAIGDGTADDASAVQAALTAANTAGGGTVYFPAGTYLVGTALTVSGNVRLLGAGSGVSTIRLDASEATTLLALQASSDVDMSGLALDADDNSATTGILVDADGSTLLITACVLGSDALDKGVQNVLDVDGACVCTVNGTRIHVGVDTTVSFSAGVFLQSGSRAAITSCTFVSVGVDSTSQNFYGIRTAASGSGASTTVTGTDFDFSSVTTANFGHAAVQGNYADDSITIVGGTVTSGSGSTEAGLWAGGATVTGCVALAVRLLGGATYGGTSLSYLGRQSLDDSAPDATYEVDFSLYERVTLGRSSASGMTLSVVDTLGVPWGSMAFLSIETGSSFTLTLGTGFSPVTSPVVIGAGANRVLAFMYNGNDGWVEMGTSADA